MNDCNYDFFVASQMYTFQGRRKVWKSGGACSTGWGECAPPGWDRGLTDLPKNPFDSPVI